MDIITGILKESYFLLNAMSPYLLFGFFFAGLLHVFFDIDLIARHLGGNNITSVIKSTLFGIPLPLCSCGVIPAAMTLRKKGASKGAVVSFLISTPTSSIDSIFATYSLMGWFFALYRAIASFFAGVLSGILTNIFSPDDDNKKPEESSKCELCDDYAEHSHSVESKLRGLFRYAFGTLIDDIGVWVLLGILMGGVITYVIPDEFIRQYLGSGWKAMLIMLIVGIPMYVCATGSIPIAAALMFKGMNPGAAFVFLLSGPATNAVSMTVIGKYMGKRALFIYIFSIAFSSLFLGISLDWIWKLFKIGDFKTIIGYHKSMLPYEVQLICSIFLLSLIVFSFVKHFSRARR